jgi:hypothetical protein
LHRFGAQKCALSGRENVQIFCVFGRIRVIRTTGHPKFDAFSRHAPAAPYRQPEGDSLMLPILMRALFGTALTAFPVDKFILGEEEIRRKGTQFNVSAADGDDTITVDAATLDPDAGIHINAPPGDGDDSVILGNWHRCDHGRI